MSILRWGLGREIDPFFGLSDVLGDYDRQMRQLTREFNRLENQFLGGQEDLPMGRLVSLVDRNAIAPRIVDENGKKVAQYNFDIKGFRPEDVHIKTDQSGRLIVSARHEDIGEDHQAIREFQRMVTLPEGVSLEDMKSRLRGDGVLTISAPLTKAIEQQQQQLKEIPIEHHSGSQKSIKLSEQSKQQQK